MAFDPQLQRVVDAAADRFRDEMARQTQAIVEELQVSANAERERAVAEARDVALREADARMVVLIAEAATEARRLGREEGKEEGRAQGEETGRAEGQKEGKAEGRQQGWEEGRAEGTLEGLERGRTEGLERGWIEGNEQGRAEGIELGRAEGIALGRTEGREQARAEGRDQGRTEGLNEGRSEGRELGRTEARGEGEHDIEAAVAKAMAEAVRTNEQSTSHVVGRWLDAARAIASARSLSAILEELAFAAEREAAHSLLFVVQNGRMETWRSGQVEAEGDIADLINEAVCAGTTISRSGRLAAPLIVGGQVVGALWAEAAQHDETFEFLARFSARCLEAVTAFQTARVLAEVPVPGTWDVAPAASTGDSAGEDAAAARRYARLLVSEIKLYHEAEVVAGRRDRDLARRLGGEIARARSLYEQRLPRDVQVDHFQEELVRTLANGDETLLTLKS